MIGEKMDDLISRSKAIQWVKAESNPYGQPTLDYESGIKVIEYLEHMPSAQPEQRWIPCSERMPEEHEWIGTKKFGTTISDKVYVTFENPEEERFVTHLSFQNGKLSSFDQSKIDAFHKGSVPIAWMPLPEPYKAIDAMRSLPSAQPTIEAEPVRRGRWVHSDLSVFGNPYGSYKCSACGNCEPHKTRYCCNCGARMEVENDY